MPAINGSNVTFGSDHADKESERNKVNQNRLYKAHFDVKWTLQHYLDHFGCKNSCTCFFSTLLLYVAHRTASKRSQ